MIFRNYYKKPNCTTTGLENALLKFQFCMQKLIHNSALISVYEDCSLDLFKTHYF